jgi:hypothetical protein
MITLLFILGLWLFIVSLSNLDIIHKSSPIGKEMAEESNYQIPQPNSWQDTTFVILLGFSIAMIVAPILTWCGVIPV